jgi:hypothetical protein
MSAWKFSAWRGGGYRAISVATNDTVAAVITYFSGNNEAERLDSARGQLETTGNFVLTDVDGVSGQEREATFCEDDAETRC